MDYISTRGSAPTLDFRAATLAGLASDGGLYVPATWPTLSQDEIRALHRWLQGTGEAVFASQATHKGLRWTLQVPTGLSPRLMGDATRLRQVLSNLISNAVQYTPDGGRIRVQLQGCDATGLVRILLGDLAAHKQWLVKRVGFMDTRCTTRDRNLRLQTPVGGHSPVQLRQPRQGNRQ